MQMRVPRQYCATLYKRRASADLGSYGGCGASLLWTRRGTGIAYTVQLMSGGGGQGDVVALKLLGPLAQPCP